MKNQRIQIEIKGLVQGIGFRPYIYQLAKELNLTGWVKNNSSGVLIEAQGEKINELLKNLSHNPPKLSHIEFINTVNINKKAKEKKFVILKSDVGNISTKISPDIGICDHCLYELFDPNSRFYHYPFINCTHCGPRFSITQNLPYDRSQTSMDDFKLCETCQKEYNDPDNRRYHAQAISCSSCGPCLSMPLEEIVSLLAEGKILAVKGMTGYQLICDAHNEKTVLELRRRKNRLAKPFAVMVLDLNHASFFAESNPLANNLLSDWTRPIVLLPKKENILNPIIAPKLNKLGIMLPSTALHYLILDGVLKYQKKISALIVTSANLSGEPLVSEDESAEEKLKDSADHIISYNRKIIMRSDDSVLHIINKKPCFIRRARGFAPNSIRLPYSIPSTLALGAYLKNTFCITRGQEAFISQHLGDLKTASSIDFFHDTLDYYLNYLNTKPERIACDLHPDFYNSHFAERFSKKHTIPIIKVQHHHAHIAAVAAEYAINEPSIGLALDGYGYGNDGSAWGGELFLYQNNGCERLAHLQPLPQPGNDKATKQTWRMAVSMLYQLGYTPNALKHFNNKTEINLVFNLLQKNKNISKTSSCGRLFDAASALLDVCLESQYEGQAAMELESLVTEIQVLKNSWVIENDTLNLLPLFKYLLNCNTAIGSNIFHGSLAAALADWANHYAKKLNTKIILISGGCFLNKILTESFIEFSTKLGLEVYYPQALPPNDGSISFGQAWLAGNRERI